MSTTSLALAARLARREVRHRPWRTLLVAFLVAVPVAAMTFSAVLVRTDSLTPLEVWQHRNGLADAVLPTRGGPTLGAADVPPGSRVITYQDDVRLLRTADGHHVSGEVTNLPTDDPMTAGVFRIEGRAPKAAGEILVSRRVAREFGLSLGGTVDLDRPLDGVFTVVGIGDRVDSYDATFVVLDPTAAFPVRPGDRAPTRLLVDFPATLSKAEIVAWARDHGATAGLSPAVAPQNSEPPVGAALRWTWVAGACALTVMGIVIASAFAAGARRQLTTLGQLAANGAPPKVLRRVLVLQGSWTGLVGAAVGLALGGVSLAVLAPHRDRLLGRYVPHYDLNLTDLVPIVLLGVVAATIAAIVPARSASRVPVMAALAGRRPQGAVPPWLTVVGVVTCAAGLGLLALAMFGVRGTDQRDGTVWGLTAVAGGVALLLGACAVAPGYVSVLGPAAARLGGSWRLAVRSLARQRGRTGAVVSAVCATTALLLAWSAIVHSSTAQQASARMPADRVLVFSRTPKAGPGPVRADAAVTPPPDAFLDQLRAVLHGPTTSQLQWAATGDGGVASIADETFLDALGLDAGQRRVLARTGVAVLGDDRVDDHAVRFTSSNGAAPVTIEAGVIKDPKGWWDRVPPILVTPERAAALGLVPQPGDVVVVQPSGPLSADQRDAVDTVFEEGLDAVPRSLAPGRTIQITEVEFARPASGPDPAVLDAIFAGIAFVFVLFVVASSLALAAAETRSERDLLTVMGASPRAIRRTSGVKAVVLSGFGVVLALPVGLLPVVLFSRIMEGGMPFIFPWRAVLLVVVALPLVAGAITTSASAVALRLRPVRTSTMAFE